MNFHANPIFDKIKKLCFFGVTYKQKTVHTSIFSQNIFLIQFPYYD